MNQSKISLVVGVCIMLVGSSIKSYDSSFPEYKPLPYQFQRSQEDEKIIKKDSWSFEALTDKQCSFVTISVVAASLMGSVYLWSQASKKDAEYIAKTYPYAQAWYNDLAQKYPQVHFSKKQFLKSLLDDDRSIRWSYFYNQIYCHHYILKNIHEIYKKVAHKKLLSDEEQLFLAIQEFGLLRQAGHIENNHVMKTRLYTISTYMALEAARIWYKDFTDTSYLLDVEFDVHARKALFNNINEAVEVNERMQLRNYGLILCELFALLCLELPCSIAQYFESYTFACQHADLDTLEKIAIFYETYDGTFRSNDWKSNVYHDSMEYALPANRGKMIRDAIKSRDIN